MSEQYSLFSQSQLRQIKRPQVKSPETLYLTSKSLQGWQQRVYRFQQQVITNLAQPRQQTLIQTQNDNDAAALTLNPFALPQQNTEFWRGRFPDVGVPALYFVSDAELPVLLYVGETCKSNARWKGEHDCKSYLMNYVALHRRYDRPVSVRISFYLDAPEDVRDRQRLEQQLIQTWRSPFNRENWKHWGTPFK
ncbi:MAG: GIY-YIG nuclease family protein [Cyanobacteria bacterium P01_F01_bin.42]